MDEQTNQTKPILHIPNALLISYFMQLLSLNLQKNVCSWLHVVNMAHYL